MLHIELHKKRKGGAMPRAMFDLTRVKNKVNKLKSYLLPVIYSSKMAYTDTGLKKACKN